VHQLGSGFHTKILKNMMGVDLYGSIAQTKLVRYFFVPQTTLNQSHDLLFALGQHLRWLGALAVFLPCELGLDVIKPVRSQSKQTVREHSTLFRRVRGWLLWDFHLEPDGSRTPATSIREMVTAKRHPAVT
jgi:hypothetical protein